MRRIWVSLWACTALVTAGLSCTEPLEGGIRRPSARPTSGGTSGDGATPSAEDRAPALTLRELESAVNKTLGQGTGRYRLEVLESYGPTSGEILVEGIGSFDLGQDLFDLRFIFSHAQGPGWGPGTKLDPHARVIVHKDELFVHGPDEQGRLGWQRYPMNQGPGLSVDLSGPKLNAAPPPLRVLPFALSVSSVDSVKEWPEFSSYEVEIHGRDMLHLIDSSWMNGYLEGLPQRELQKIFEEPAKVQIGVDDEGMVRSMKTPFDPYFLSAIGASLRRGDMKLKQARREIDYLDTFDVVFIAWIHALGDDVRFSLPELDDIRGRSV